MYEIICKLIMIFISGKVAVTVNSNRRTWPWNFTFDYYIEDDTTVVYFPILAIYMCFILYIYIYIYIDIYIQYIMIVK